jgi:hypothetical protein
VATELVAFGFRWFDSGAPEPFAEWLDHPDVSLLEHNQKVAEEQFNLADLPRRLEPVLTGLPGLFA